MYNLNLYRILFNQWDKCLHHRATYMQRRLNKQVMLKKSESLFITLLKRSLSPLIGKSRVCSLPMFTHCSGSWNHHFLLLQWVHLIATCLLVTLQGRPIMEGMHVNSKYFAARAWSGRWQQPRSWQASRQKRRISSSCFCRPASSPLLSRTKDRKSMHGNVGNSHLTRNLFLTYFHYVPTPRRGVPVSCTSAILCGKHDPPSRNWRWRAVRYQAIASMSPTYCFTS